LGTGRDGTQSGITRVEPDRIRSAWQGRISGCVLGKPLEVLSFREGPDGVRRYLHDAGATPLRDYVPLLDEATLTADGRACCLGHIGRAEPDDDIDYTLLALMLVEEHGVACSTEDVARAWLRLLPAGATWTAERAAYRTLLDCMAEQFVNGEPPGFDLCECSDNAYNDWIGGQIRADLYGWICPGRPALAAELARRDASLSHRGDGVHAAAFIAALAAALPACGDLDRRSIRRSPRYPQTAAPPRACNSAARLPVPQMPCETASALPAAHPPARREQPRSRRVGPLRARGRLFRHGRRGRRGGLGHRLQWRHGRWFVRPVGRADRCSLDESVAGAIGTRLAGHAELQLDDVVRRTVDVARATRLNYLLAAMLLLVAANAGSADSHARRAERISRAASRGCAGHRRGCRRCGVAGCRLARNRPALARAGVRRLRLPGALQGRLDSGENPPPRRDRRRHPLRPHRDPLVQYWDDDCLEIFLDEDFSGGDHQYNHNAFAYHVSLDNQAIDIGTDKAARNYSTTSRAAGSSRATRSSGSSPSTSTRHLPG
jgi:hypothetical protein